MADPIRIMPMTAGACAVVLKVTPRLSDLFPDDLTSMALYRQIQPHFSDAGFLIVYRSHDNLCVRIEREAGHSWPDDKPTLHDAAYVEVLVAQGDPLPDRQARLDAALAPLGLCLNRCS